VKVVIAHNRYREAQPSGENRIVDLEIEQLRGAGVAVVPFLRSSDAIGSLPLAQKALLPLGPVWSPSSARDLRVILREERPDVVHLHNPYPLISPWVVRTAHAAGVPVVQTVHNYRQVCASGLYFRDGGICTDCRGRAFALPAIVHNCYRDSKAQSAVMATALAVHRGTWRSVDRYIALTDAIATHLESYGIASDRIVVKPNSIPDPGAFDAAVTGNGLAFIGRLTPEKGLALLLDAWTQHPVGLHGTLRIAGDGPLRPVAESAAAARSDIVYLGSLDAAGVRATLRDSAALVAPSTWHDVLPTVIIEALAAGRPVLGSNLGGIPYLIGDAGWTVEATSAAFAEALPRVQAEAPGLRGVARQRYLTTFHPDVVLTRQLEVYASLARG
jgi:glycosyltransferase involved in cell wall biosynthesis